MLEWQARGAKWIHLVDLDAAFDRGFNTELLASVIGQLDIEVHLSGGVVDNVSVQRALSTGCSRIFLEGSIVGKELYDGRFTFAEALEAVQ